MPPSTYPSRWGFFMDLLGQRWPWIGNEAARRFRQYAVTYWTAHEPVRVSALSGGHVLLRYQALLSVNGLFDPDFFMYWEDSDLMRRLNDRGWRLYMEPHARAVHWYDHSTKKDTMLERGWPVFREKHFSGWMWRKLMLFAQKAVPMPANEELTRLSATTKDGFTIHVPTAMQDGWLLEVSPSRNFVPSIGRFGRGAVAQLPLQLAARLQNRDYYLRMGRTDGLDSDHATYVFNMAHLPNDSPILG